MPEIAVGQLHLCGLAGRYRRQASSHIGFVMGLGLLLTPRHMLQVPHQQIQLAIGQHTGVKRRHLRLWPMPQALRVADVTLEEIPAEILGGVVGNIQVRPHLRIAGAIEPMTRQSILLKQRKALVDRVIRRQLRVR